MVYHQATTSRRLFIRAHTRRAEGPGLVQLLVCVLYIVIVVIPFVDTGGSHDVFILRFGIFRFCIEMTFRRQRGEFAKFPPDMTLDALVVGTNQEEPWSRVVLDEMI